MLRLVRRRRVALSGFATAVVALAAFAGSCGGATSGAVIVIDTALCERTDPGGPAEWGQIVVTVNSDQVFCAAYDDPMAPDDCVSLGTGTFPLVLPIESESGAGTIPVQIELFENPGDSAPIACETTALTLQPDSVIWAYTAVQRPCGTDGSCEPGTLTPMPGWRSIADVIREMPNPITCAEPDPAPTFPIRRVATGFAHACLVDAMGRLFCWGQNAVTFQAGVNDNDLTRPRLVDLRGSDRFVIDVALGRRHSCAIYVESMTRRVTCWGLNDRHQLGRGGMPGGTGGNLDFTPINAINTPTQVALGSDHSCALTDAGDVFCWGDNEQGQVDGRPGGVAPSPVQVSLPAPAVWIAAGGRAGSGEHSCAVLDDGTIHCWGASDDGQLGHRMMSGPAGATGMLANATQVAIGGLSTCGVGNTNTLYCWGQNQQPGTLGFPAAMQEAIFDSTPVDTTVRVAPLAPPGMAMGPAPATLGSGDQYHCVIDSATQRPSCFGINENGRLGRSDPFVAEPTRVNLPGNLSTATFTEIALGDTFACALPEETVTGPNGNMPVCWGDNTSGQRGVAGEGMDPAALQLRVCN